MPDDVFTPDPVRLPVDLALSQQLAELGHDRPKQCWKNAALAALSLGADRAPVYVEGLCHSTVIPLPHGWLVVAGQVVDPTFYRLALDFGHAPTVLDRYVYYPVYTWTFDALDRDLRALVGVQAQQQRYLPFHDHAAPLRRRMFQAEQQIYARLTGVHLDFVFQMGT